MRKVFALVTVLAAAPFAQVQAETLLERGTYLMRGIVACGNWTDAQLMVAIRDGKRPDGSLIGPPMPYDMYRGLSDRDTKAIIAYLRSLKPVKNATRKSVYQMPLPPAYGPPVGSIPDVSRTDKVAYGAYLAGPLGHCMECHTPMTKPPFRDYKT